MNQNTVTVQLTVKDDGSVVMKQFGQMTEDSMNKAGNSTTKAASTFSSGMSKFQSAALTTGAAIAAVEYAIAKMEQAIELMDKGAKAAQAEDAFNSLASAAGDSADEILKKMKEATNGTIDDSLLMQKAVKASLLDMTSEQTTQISEMARMAARATGEDVSTTFDNIVNAMSTNMPKALKQYGLITKEQQSIVNQALAEGVDDVNLMSIAWENYNKQLEMTGPLTENDAEKIQQWKAAANEAGEALGNLFNALANSAVSWSTDPMDKYFGRLAGLTDEEMGDYKIVQAVKADLQKESATAALKASQQAGAQRKIELEILKALDKDYFTSQEAQIKAMEEIKKAASEDDYIIASDSLKRQEELNTEFYMRTKAEIEKEAAARAKADRDKISDAVYAAQKMQALDAETASKATNLIRQRTLLSVQTAQNDIKNLTTRLGEYQTYYDSLKAKMDKNIEDEKKHLEELKALRQQSVDLDKSTAAMISGIKGMDKSQSAQQQYEASRSALNSQYGSALNMSGQDEIKALEEYKQAVAALQQQYAQGIPGAADIFGKPGEIISAKNIAEDAISDIERATQNQKNAIVKLEAEKQNQIEADRLWGQVIQEETAKAQTAMDNLKATIAELSTQIQNMEKTITLSGDDQVSGVVDSIIARIKQLHDLAKDPIILTTTSGGVFSSKSSIGSDGFTNFQNTLSTNDSGVLDGYADGTNYVPRTGKYMLHQGEAVIPAAENKGGKSITFGDVIIQIPANAAPQSKEDWRAITRNYIVPELRKLQ